MIRLPCDQCAATGWATHGDRHTETNMDQCQTCQGTGYMSARTGETREASAPISREEWCRRFVAELTRLADGAAYCPMSMQPLAEYAEEAAEAWFEDSDGLTPETCAGIEKDMLE